MRDADDLERFVEAQRGSYETARRELAAGRKSSHWMWFIFPQMRGLGHSPTAQFYGVASLDEARAYLAHDVLGPRLRACAALALAAQAPDLRTLFGSPDDLKFCSSMTLFAEAAGEEDSVFVRALGRWCDGRRDQRTLALIS